MRAADTITLCLTCPLRDCVGDHSATCPINQARRAEAAIEREAIRRNRWRCTQCGRKRRPQGYRLCATCRRAINGRQAAKRAPKVKPVVVAVKRPTRREQTARFARLAYLAAIGKL